MNTSLRTASAALLVGLAALTACGDDPVGSRPDGTIDASGGTVQAASGAVTLVFPAGAVSKGVGITVRPSSTAPQDPRLVAGTAYEFGPEGIQFAQPVQLSIRYDEARLPSGASEASLVLHRAVGNGWERIDGGSADASSNVVTAPVRSFGTYAVLSVPVGSVVLTLDSTRLITGDSARLSASARDRAGVELTGRALLWISSDTSVATVSGTGVVRGVGVGPVSIIASSEQKSDTARITVSPLASRSMAVGKAHSCALNEAGAAYCWGANDQGQLGTGASTRSTTPVAVSGGTRFVAISAGANTTCALTAQGSAFCWGANSNGQLGNGGGAASNVPVAVAGGLRFQQISVGGSASTCGLTTSGSAYCWGGNQTGALGTGDTISARVPAPVSGGLTFRSLSTGLNHTCGITTAGATYCWGWNLYFQINGLRTGSNLTEPLPVQVMQDLTLTSVQGGATTTCGLDGANAYCWGSDFAGSRGTGTTSGVPRTRTQVTGGTAFASLHMGKENNHNSPSCGLTLNGSAYCWGSNNQGQLGTSAALGTCVLSEPFPCTGTPVPVAGGLFFAVVTPAGGHTCGITRDQRAFCWGGNESGQLGQGTEGDSPRSVPSQVGGIRFP